MLQFDNLSASFSLNSAGCKLNCAGGRHSGLNGPQLLSLKIHFCRRTVGGSLDEVCLSRLNEECKREKQDD